MSRGPNAIAKDWKSCERDSCGWLDRSRDGMYEGRNQHEFPREEINGGQGSNGPQMLYPLLQESTL